MTVELRGVAAAPGVADGAPWIHRPAAAGAGSRRPLPEAASEAVAELDRLAAGLRAAGRADEAAILEAQALMAADPELLDAATAAVASGTDPVEAIHAAGEAAAAIFEGLDDEILSARAADVRDVAARIARHVVGAPAPRIDAVSIVVANDLPPSVTVELDRALLAGIALEGGSRTSHAAILARALGIPAVVAVPGLVSHAEGASLLAVDGDAGRVLVNPDEAARATVVAAREAAARRRDEETVFRARPLTTADGHRVTCAANVGSPAEARAAFDAGAEAIGLFRTEFLFASRSEMPDEALQADAYADVLEAAGDRPVVVRLADIGGDKPLPYVRTVPEANPFLGLRAIRLAEANPSLFPTQIRAILRASARTGRTASIMAPMVADVGDVARLREWVEDARRAVPAAPAPRIGIMVEVPSAVLLADRLAVEVDFMSIGTNDLTAYLLAADRANAALAAWQDALHPAVLRAVAHIVEAAHAARGCEVAVCGELAGEPAGARALVGLGIDELSMDPASFGSVKRHVGQLDHHELQSRARRALELSTAADVRAEMGA